MQSGLNMTNSALIRSTNSRRQVVREIKRQMDGNISQQSILKNSSEKCLVGQFDRLNICSFPIDRSCKCVFETIFHHFSVFKICRHIFFAFADERVNANPVVTQLDEALWGTRNLESLNYLIFIRFRGYQPASYKVASGYLFCLSNECILLTSIMRKNISSSFISALLSGALMIVMQIGFSK